MNRILFQDLDWGLLTPVLVLVAISLTTLFSINVALFKNQLLFFAISIVAFLFFSQINDQLMGRYALQIYLVSVLILFLLLIIGIESRGAVRWFDIFGFRIQFSELLKPFLAISLSFFLAKRNNYSFKTFSFSILFLFPIALLIFMQPDLGSSLIYVAVTILALLVFGFPLRFFAALLILLTLLMPVLWQFLEPFQKQRIFSFLNPTDPLGFSYNAIQSIIAIGSGMFFGRGFGLGSQSTLHFLPERHTDFIFATISEGLGFVGIAIILLCFLFLLYRIFLVYSRAEDLPAKTFSQIVFILIFLQFFINIAMNTGLLPIVGITLPFLSYGGSSLLSSFILLGILSAVSKKSASYDILEIK